MSMDGFNLAEIHDIPLTAVHVPRDELGAEALRLLQQRTTSPGALFRHLLLSGRLYVGNSVKRPPIRKARTTSGRNHGLYGNLAT
jgi:DNA-binding LacI/PurR family transcriptional regulator